MTPSALPSPGSLAHEYAMLDGVYHHLIDVCHLDAHTAWDMAQEVMAEYTARRPVAAAAGVLEPYAFVIIRSRLRDHVRRGVVEREHLAAFAAHERVHAPARARQNTADRVFDARELRRLLIREAEALPPQMRRAFLRRCLDDMSTGTVAAELGISPCTVTLHVQEATRRLRPRMEALGYLESRDASNADESVVPDGDGDEPGCGGWSHAA